VLNKVMTGKVRLCLIAPCWPSHAWFPTPLELLTDHPRRLPELDHLLRYPLGSVCHNSLSFYKLHAWKLLGASSEQNNFLRTLSATLAHPYSEVGNHWRLSVNVVCLPNLVWERRSSSSLSHSSQVSGFSQLPIHRKEAFCLSH
jgi:hypothetical protein